MNSDQMQEALTGLTPDTQLRRHQLAPGKFYRGEGRFIGGIALWTGEVFLGFTFKLGGYCDASAYYGEFGFTPLEEIE